MAHIGIERLSAGHAQKNTTEDEKAARTTRKQIMQALAWIDGDEHRRVLHDLPQAKQANREKSQRHSGSESTSYPGGSEWLDGKKCDQDDNSGRNNKRRECRRGNVQAFKR